MLTFIIAKKHTINYCDDMTMIKFTVNMFDMILYGIIYIYDTIIIHEHDKVAIFVIFPMYPNAALEGTANIS